VLPWKKERSDVSVSEYFRSYCCLEMDFQWLEGQRDDFFNALIIKSVCLLPRTKWSQGRKDHYWTTLHLLFMLKVKHKREVPKVANDNSLSWRGKSKTGPYKSWFPILLLTQIGPWIFWNVFIFQTNLNHTNLKHYN
jgi:hypothetical protein